MLDTIVYTGSGAIIPYSNRCQLKVVYDYPDPHEELSSSTMIPKVTAVAGLTRGAD